MSVFTKQRPLRGFFVSGIGTDVGKTVVTAALLRAGCVQGWRLLALKPVQTGVTPTTTAFGDSHRYEQALQGCAVGCARTLQSFSLAASPHLAAEQEGKRLSVASLQHNIRDAWYASDAQGMLIEGAGGVFVPLNREEDTLDLMARLGLPVLLVGSNYLGALNHFLLSFEAIASRGLSLAGVVLVETQPTHERSEAERCIHEDNCRLLQERLGRMAPTAPFIHLPFLAGLAEGSSCAWEEAAACCTPLLPVLERHLEPLATTNAQREQAQLQERDEAVLWHPYTSSITPLPVFAMERSYGNRLVLTSGEELIDGMSSWWTAIHGYNHPQLLAALRSQAGRMPHVMFGGITHKPAVHLAERLRELVPEGLDRVFLADSGSVAVEVALKMALQYQQGRGERRRTRCLTIRGGYHGDTFGAMSVCDPVTGMHTLFRGVLLEQLFVARPSCRFDGAFDPASLDEVRQVLEQHGDNLAAVIVEPIVQGAGGMWFYHPDYLRALVAVCRERGLVVIFDEIATGFGRTGRLFALEHAQVVPDILCCGKALTGGVMTLAATICGEHIAEGICADGQVFMHGPTFMGNPLACAVANASLDLLASGAWKTQVAALEATLQEGLAPCRAFSSVADVRVLGGIGVVEMVEPVSMARLQAFFVRQGVWIRPFQRLIYLMPPYCSPREDVQQLCKTLVAAVEQGL